MSVESVQALLRFLTGPAKISLATALGKAKLLMAEGLTSPEAISQAESETIKKIFSDEKMYKTLLSAAKRHSAGVVSEPPKRKRALSPTSLSSAEKRAKTKSELILPSPVMDVAVLSSVTITTNRAPLLMAFAFVALEYTTSQPLDSRLSLAQGVVSANVGGKARSIGLSKREQDEEEKKLLGGLGKSGQPRVKVLGKEVVCLRRYDVETLANPEAKKEKIEGKESHEEEPIFWALSLEDLAKQNTVSSASSSHLPIHTPQSALSYLQKTFSAHPILNGPNPTPASPSNSKLKPKNKFKGSLDSLPYLLGALHLLFQSWSKILSKEELNHRAWSWYCNVRPEVPTGADGWGVKGPVELGKILSLRR